MGQRITFVGVGGSIRILGKRTIPGTEGGVDLAQVQINVMGDDEDSLFIIGLEKTDFRDFIKECQKALKQIEG